MGDCTTRGETFFTISPPREADYSAELAHAGGYPDDSSVRSGPRDAPERVVSWRLPNDAVLVECDETDPAVPSAS